MGESPVASAALTLVCEAGPEPPEQPITFHPVSCLEFKGIHNYLRVIW